MNELQIDYFLAVAETLSFTKTASDKYVSQPAVSKQISMLEEELGVRLFDRGSKSTKLTEAGKLFSEYFKKHYAELEHIRQLSKSAQELGAVSFCIATGQSWFLEKILNPVKDKISVEYPKARITMENIPFDELDPALYEGRADVVIGMEHAFRSSPMLRIKHFTNVQRQLVYSKQHPLAGKKKLTPLDFKDDIFFFPAAYEKSYVKNLVKACVEPYGFIPKLQPVSNDLSMLSSVINGFGVCMVDTWTLEAYGGALKAVKLDTYHEVAIAWKTGNANPILKIFLNEISPL